MLRRTPRGDGAPRRVGDVWGICVDDVAYVSTGGAVGFWLVCLLTGRRHRLVSLKKRRLCGCGCSSRPVSGLFLRWCLQSLADRTFPSQRHDSRPWRPLDLDARAAKAQRMIFHFACLFIKAGWARVEHSSSFGLSAHNNGIRPCLKCNAHDGNTHDTSGCNCMGLTWQKNEDGAYDAA